MDGQYHGLEWEKETCQFNEAFIKSYNKDSDESYFFEVDVQYPEELSGSISIYLFHL